MMFVVKYLVCILCTMCIICGEVCAEEYDYASAIKIAKIGDDLIQTARGELVFVSADLDTTSSTYATMKAEVAELNKANTNSGTSISIRVMGERYSIKYLYAKDGNKVRYDMQNNSTEKSIVQHTKSYDGEKTTVVTYNIDKGLLDPRAFIMDAPFLDMMQSPFCFGYFVFRNDISEILTTRSVVAPNLMISGITFEKSEKVGELEADKFVGNDDDGTSYALWLSKNLLYRPVKLEINYKGVSSMMDIEIRYKSASNNTYLPDFVTGKNYIVSDKGKELTNEFTLDYILEKTDINVSVDEKDFVVELPEGLIVHSQR